ncbi:outer membrane protein transport protein [uncultured Shimia sp.]|uniref:OmpP1/FadL family transporter n=1 Tax=uncultured Shimia sp. TaxID=573152 RepID=UPI002618C4D6|nr:outer membrane protein transport protein [uncultured Shimia sp.]
MKKALWGATALTLAASTSFAGGIDRSGQGVNILFEEGNYAQFTWRHVSPSVDGSTSGVTHTTDVLPSYNNLSFGYKHEINENWDVALIYDQPFGAHVAYTNGPFTGGGADINSDALTALVQYNFGNGFSIHGGARALKVSGNITSGLGMLDASSDYDWGGVLGVAYEKPEIALRVALTYANSINSGFEGTHNVVSPRTFDVDFPESVNLDFQTGVAANTLVFGSVRWAGWGGFSLDTTDGNWVNFTDDTIEYTLGVGRQINDKLSLALQLGYEKSGTRPTTTLLSPTTGSTSIGLGATYQVNEKFSVSGGLTYAMLGDQFFRTGATSTVDFNDSTAWGAGLRLGYRF